MKRARLIFREPAAPDALGVFATLGKNPGYFRDWFFKLGSAPQFSLDQALAAVFAAYAEEQKYEENWLAISPLARALARYIAQGGTQPFGKDAEAAVASITGSGGVSSSRRQTALNSLVNRGIIEVWNKRYAIADPLMVEWIANRPADNFRTST